MTNNTIDIMLAHRSIRSFTDRTVSDENLDAYHPCSTSGPKLGKPATRFHDRDKRGRTTKTCLPICVDISRTLPKLLYS